MGIGYESGETYFYPCLAFSWMLNGRDEPVCGALREGILLWIGEIIFSGLRGQADYMLVGYYASVCEY
jgi:hypothetical protein